MSTDQNKHMYQKPVRSAHRSHPVLRLFIVALVLVIGLAAFFNSKGHADSDLYAIKSGISGYCLDAHHSGTAAGTPVDAWRCNNTGAQAWKVAGFAIQHDDDTCLAVAQSATTSDSPVALETCSDAPGQVWLRDGTGYQNPNSGLCLSAPSRVGAQLTASNCTGLGQAAFSWTSNAGATTCNGTERQKIACYAAQDWDNWQTNKDHEALLTAYTGGAPYEEWCADFVSYIYKQAGYPFTGGAGGWDQNVADQIQYMGFTKHDASGYTPRAGDVAFFDYPGGHVEVVVAGGAHPTFIYGDSAHIDPLSGNGNMEANTITQDGNRGQVVYYLSPN